MLRSPLRLLWSLVLTVAGLPKWLLAAWIMLLTLISSDFHAEASAHPQLLSGAAWSERLVEPPSLPDAAPHSELTSQSLPRQLGALLGNAALAMAHSSHPFRAVPSLPTVAAAPTWRRPICCCMSGRWSGCCCCSAGWLFARLCFIPNNPSLRSSAVSRRLFGTENTCNTASHTQPPDSSAFAGEGSVRA